MRLDKYLADAGVGTRSEVKKLIYWKKVGVDGITVTDPAYHVPEGAEVTLKGTPVEFHAYEYWMLNKPAGIVSESRKNSLKRGEKVAEGEERTVVDLIRETRKNDLFPAGRLDRDTEGLLLVTNDGKLSHNLLSPAKHVEKKYYAELSAPLPEADRTRITSGVDIGDEKPTKPCRIEMLTEQSLFITISEGRYHQIKRMFETAGLKVTYLKRVAFASLTLDESLKPGEYRALTAEEIDALKKENTNHDK